MSARSRRRSANASRSGQALVEFALVVPLLLILLLGVVEFGRQVITDAAREAARTAAIDDTSVTQDSVIAVVQDALGRAGLDPADASITVAGIEDPRGMPSTVSIQYPYDFVFLRPFIGWLDTQGLVTLKTTFSMRNE